MAAAIACSALNRPSMRFSASSIGSGISTTSNGTPRRPHPHRPAPTARDFRRAVQDRDTVRVEARGTPRPHRQPQNSNALSSSPGSPPCPARSAGPATSGSEPKARNSTPISSELSGDDGSPIRHAPRVVEIRPSFDMAANHKATVRAAVQLQHHPYSPVLTKDISVGPKPCRFAFTASSNVQTTTGVVTFQLGGHDTETS